MYIHPPPPLNQSVTLSLPVTPAMDSQGRYLHWDDIRHRPIPEGFDTKEAYWRQVKRTRLMGMTPLPFVDNGGQPFHFYPPALEKSLHQIDRGAVGMIGFPSKKSLANADFHLINGLMDEAIHSSQLEGAATTRAHAEQMLRENRQPADHDERMIHNNYRAIRHISEEWSEQPLTLDHLCELHSILTNGTLDHPADEGRIRNCDEDDKGFGVYDTRKNLLHTPPPWRKMEESLQRLCDFANDETDEPFIHPVCRAMITHFMLAYLHPFTDGNGRTARGLFFWMMNRHQYWTMKHISISAVLNRKRRDYYRAFLLSENDGGDITYFLTYHAEIILKALNSLERWVEKREKDLREVRKRLQAAPSGKSWNTRQMSVLRSALQDRMAEYTTAGHAGYHNITVPTAIADLDRLSRAGFLVKGKRGKRFVYTPSPRINKQWRR